MKQIAFCGNKNVSGKVIERLRKEKKISQEDLAAKMQTLGVNIDQQMISRIEKNQRQVTDYELACFSVCLECDSKKLLEEFFKMI